MVMVMVVTADECLELAYRLFRRCVDAVIKVPEFALQFLDILHPAQLLMICVGDRNTGPVDLAATAGAASVTAPVPQTLHTACFSWNPRTG